MTKEELLEVLNELLEAVEEAAHISMRLSSRTLKEYEIYDRVDEGELALGKFASDLHDIVHEVNDH
jgi:hypothetical protein